MFNGKQVLPITAVALVAAALVPAGSHAGSGGEIERGTYDGTTLQPRAGSAPYRGDVSVKLGLFSTPPRLVRFVLETRLTCADGSTRDDRAQEIVAFGPKLDGRGRFTYRGDGIVISGRFTPGGAATGTAERTDGDCSATGVRWTARN